MITVNIYEVPRIARNKRIYSSSTNEDANTTFIDNSNSENYVIKKGSESQEIDGDIIIKGNIYAQGDITAFSSIPGISSSWWDAMPTASATVKGGVKIGANLSIDSNGVISAQAGGVSSWNDLQNKPTWLDYSTLTNFQAGHGHSWTAISDKPTFANVAISGSYNDLFNKPSLFDGAWASLSGKPTTLAGYGITDAQPSSTAWNTGNFTPSNYLPLSGGTITGNIVFESGVNSCEFPAHFFRKTYDGSNVYDHYYPIGGNGGTISIANLRVWDGAGSYKLLSFKGNGDFVWDGNTVWHSGNLNRTDTNILAYNIALGGGWIKHTNGEIFLGGNLHIDSYNGNEILLNYFSGAKVGIGIIPSYKLDVNGDTYVRGNITATGNITAYSDRSLKANIKPLYNTLEKVLKLQGVSYNRIDLNDNRTHIGLIAQDVESVYPEFVITDSKGIRSLNYASMVSVLIEAIKEQQKEIERLKAWVK